MKMSKPNSIKINEVEYIRKDAKSATDGDIKIVVLDRSFVYVGMVSFDDDFVVIKKAYNIRRWGTTKGLGQLSSGPTSSTVLDHYGIVKAPLRALISIIDVEQDKWNCI
jgi:hypothetical protein